MTVRLGLQLFLQGRRAFVWIQFVSASVLNQQKCLFSGKCDTRIRQEVSPELKKAPHLLIYLYLSVGRETWYLTVWSPMFSCGQWEINECTDWTNNESSKNFKGRRTKNLSLLSSVWRISSTGFTQSVMKAWTVNSCKYKDTIFWNMFGISQT